MNVIAFVFDDVAFVRVAVVDAPSIRRRHLRHHPAAGGQAGFPVSRRGHAARRPFPQFLPSTSFFVFSAHLRSTSPCSAAPAPDPPTRPTPPAGKESSGQRARKEENCRPRERAAGSAGQSAAEALWPSGRNWAELRAGGARSLPADRGRETETETETERVLSLVAAASALACAGEFWSARAPDGCSSCRAAV